MPPTHLECFPSEHDTHASRKTEILHPLVKIDGVDVLYHHRQYRQFAPPRQD
eukprot:JP441191.1.p3 GENE.JP441191.1~~JP441191.1.p3  ORF type:complete len:52 (+),score=2.63 JP441191.1:72-227(+)